MHRKVPIIAATVLLSVSAGPAINAAVHLTASTKTSIADIVLNPAKYDRMQVKVEGAVVKVRSVPSPLGGPALTGFLLVDGKTGARIGVVYVKRALEVKDPARVTVQGIYYKDGSQTGNTNVIEALFVN
jgi:hypothetical protein